VIVLDLVRPRHLPTNEILLGPADQAGKLEWQQTG
jgi:hypothetical protein